MSATQPAIAVVKRASNEDYAATQLRSSKIARYKFQGNWLLFWLLFIFGMTLPFAILYLVNRTVRFEIEVEVAKPEQVDNPSSSPVGPEKPAHELDSEFAWLWKWRDEALAEIRKLQQAQKKD